MLKNIIIFFVVCIQIYIGQFVLADDSNRLIKVGISTNDFSKYEYRDIIISATGEYEIVDTATGEMVSEIPANTLIKISLKGGFFTLSQKDNIIKTSLEGPIAIKVKDGLLTVNGLKRAGKPALYRGVFEVVPKSGRNTFCLVNVLDLESYLKGVVPNEMPVRFGLEALKAQTVAARNYALRPRVTPYTEYNLCDSVACQVYFGANTEKELSNQAIKETAGIVALDKDDELILALYSSTAGGYTESYENAFSDPETRIFPAKPLHYLKAKPDVEGTPILDTEEAAREFYTSEPLTFDNESRFFRWKREWQKQELEDVLKKTLIEQSTTGFVSPKATKQNISNFGNLKEILPCKRGESGKIAVLAIITDKTTYYVQKELVIRRLFKKDGKAIPSGNFVIDKNTDEYGNISFVFQGGGYGHGVGISQYGAGGMGKLGYKFDDILTHYYSGIKLATNPVILKDCDSQNVADRVFYTQNKKGFLNIDNLDGIKSMSVIINGHKIDFEFSIFSEKYMRFDVSKYIVKGNNTVVFCINDIDNKGKELKAFIEIREAENDNR